jgi:hypothetical protein
LYHESDQSVVLPNLSYLHHPWIKGFPIFTTIGSKWSG